MTENQFIKKYGKNPFFIFARDVVGGQLKEGQMSKGFEVLDDLEAFFKGVEHYAKAQNIVDFRNKWRQEIKESFKIK